MSSPTVEYGSDLHWFRGWGECLEAYLSRDPDDGSEWQPNRCDWIRFRPDSEARNAMLRFAAKYPQVIAQVREYLDHAEWAFADLLRVTAPDECTACGNSRDYNDYGGTRHCWVCGQKTQIPTPTEEELRSAMAAMEDALPNLARVIIVAADAIEQQELPAVGLANGQPAEIKWSRPRSANEWCKVLAVDGHAISDDTFRRMRNDGRLRVHPGSKRGAYRIDLRDLPPGTD